MSIPFRPSSPIKDGHTPLEILRAKEAHKDPHVQKLLQEVDAATFLQTYLSGCSIDPIEWLAEEEDLILQIQNVGSNPEESLYTGSSPLLRLLNSVSERVLDSTNGNQQEALVFRTAHKRKILNPFTNKQHLSPDIVALWGVPQVFQTIDYPNDRLPDTTWCALAVVGEVKLVKREETRLDGYRQLATYLRYHLWFHPELNAVLGFAAMPDKYALFYHDANVIHYSTFDWKSTPGPLYAFVKKLYAHPFRDTSMQILDINNPGPAWVTKIGNEVYISETPRPLPGPGQRRYTALALNVSSPEVVFLKDIWRDQGRFFFEALLYKQAHEGEHLSGLMLPVCHGYVLDESEERVWVSSGSVTGHSSARHKMRMMTRDIGRLLEEARSLREFLCVMYDACVVQRNLYRKCRILHRDISDGNIMLAPDSNEYRNRCAKGYAQVRFVNQVLAKDKDTDPEPTCLVIDLGNGADLKVDRGQEVLRERTGTPKFIARSVSSGKLLRKGEYGSAGVDLPPMGGTLGEYSQYMHTTGYQDHNSPGLATQSETKFTHQLFHDAESTFWVIAWTLARSTREGNERETDPDSGFIKFFYTMGEHYPEPGAQDTRSMICERDEDYWKSVLHPDLAIMAPMLCNMFVYIRPEWAYRPELNPEHVHEALMRLLLAEIVRIDETDTNIPLATCRRQRPPRPANSQVNTTSLSLNPTMSTQRTSHSIGTRPDPPTGIKPNNGGPSEKPTNSGSAEAHQAGESQPSQQAEPGSGATTAQESAARIRLREQGRSLVWQRNFCNLEEPQQAPPNEASEGAVGPA